jgi:hypothetical protein
MSIRCIAVIGMSLLSAGVSAQDFTAHMEKFLRVIQQADAISYEANVRVIYDAGAPQVQQIQYVRTPETIYYKTPQMELFADKIVSVMVYPTNKVVMWGKAGKENAINERDLFQLDSTYARPDSVQYTGKTEGIEHFIVYSSKHNISKSEYFFRSSDGLLIRSVYYYNARSGSGIVRSEVSFTSFKLNKDVPVQAIKNRTSVLNSLNKQYVLTPAYTGYKLIYLDTK